MQKVQSVDRAFRILSALGRTARPLSALDLAREVDLPRPTVSRLLHTMQASAVVERVPDANTYRLGPTILSLSAVLPFSRQLTAVAQPHLQILARETGETIYLSVPDGEQVHYVDQINSRYHIQPIDWIGSRVPLHTVAGGKLFLAHWPTADLGRYLTRPLQSFTEHTICDPDVLRQQLAQARQQGHAATRDEFEEGLVAFAAPIFGVAEQPLAAVTIAGPSYRLPPEEDQKFIEQIKNTAETITQCITPNSQFLIP